jgi:RNA polymerase sigma factor (sigma-70 family)
MSMPEYNEKEALALLANGDERGFRAIYDRYARAIFYVCNKWLQDEDAADDVVHELFTSIWGAKRETFVKVEDFKPYLYNVAKYQTFTILKDQSKKERAEGRFMEKYFTQEVFEEEDNVSERMALVMKAVETMPPQRKQVFTLGHLEGLSHEDIAKKLGIDKYTVNNHMSLALQSIRSFNPNKQPIKKAPVPQLKAPSTFIPLKKVIIPAKVVPVKKSKVDTDMMILAKAVELRKSGLSYREIASQLKINGRTICNRIHKTYSIDPSLKTVKLPRLTGSDQEILNKMPHNQKQIILLRQDGMAFNDIAKKLGLTRNTVQVTLSKGMKRIREARG